MFERRTRVKECDAKGFAAAGSASMKMLETKCECERGGRREEKEINEQVWRAKERRIAGGSGLSLSTLPWGDHSSLWTVCMPVCIYVGCVCHSPHSLPVGWGTPKGRGDKGLLGLVKEMKSAGGDSSTSMSNVLFVTTVNMYEKQNCLRIRMCACVCLIKVSWFSLLCFGLTFQHWGPCLC